MLAIPSGAYHFGRSPRAGNVLVFVTTERPFIEFMAIPTGCSFTWGPITALWDATLMDEQVSRPSQ